MVATPYSVASYSPEESVGYLVARVRASLFAAVDREMAPHGCHNYCCGGGSGFAIMSGHNFAQWRHRMAGRRKFRQVLEAFQFTGISDIEFKYNTRTGTWSFIEINPRPAGLIEIAPRAGADLAWLAYRDLTGDPIPSRNRYRTGVRIVNEEMDPLAFWALRRRGDISISAWVESLLPALPPLPPCQLNPHRNRQ